MVINVDVAFQTPKCAYSPHCPLAAPMKRLGHQPGQRMDEMGSVGRSSAAKRLV
jgi:hypothetical protein